jgi:hypothetical protein
LHRDGVISALRGNHHRREHLPEHRIFLAPAFPISVPIALRRVISARPLTET